jgi:hypothetical protein
MSMSIEMLFSTNEVNGTGAIKESETAGSELFFELSNELEI